jgi:endoglucanase
LGRVSLLLGKYSNVCGAAGDEEDVRKCILNEIKGLADQIQVNPLGNLTAVRYGVRQNRSILLTAHMDEVAFIVKSVEKNGLIRFYPIGGIISKILIGNAVVLGRERTPGVMAYKSLHLIPSQERNKVPDQKQLFIDVGASKAEEAKNVQPGDYVYFRSEFFAQKNYYYGKAFDDRAGCTAVTQVIKEYAKNKKPEVSIIAVFTAQEEVGLRGAATAAYGLKGLLFNLNLEGTTCSDRELKKTYSPSTEMGRGPAITFMDRTTIVNRRLFEFVVEVAEKNNIPFQLKRTVTGGTDSGAIHLTEEGIPSVTVSVPIRYIHSPWGIIDKKDFSNYVQLACAVLREGKRFQREA